MSKRTAGSAPVGNIRSLIRVVQLTYSSPRKLSAIKPEVTSSGNREAKVRVISRTQGSRLPILPGRKNNQTLSTTERNIRKGPFLRCHRVITKGPSVEINGRTSNVVEFNPILLFAIRIFHAIEIIRKELIDYQYVEN